MFYRVVTTDALCRKIWDNTKKISADEPHKIQKYGPFFPLNNSIKQEIDEKHTPIYKLTWKYDHIKYIPSSVLYYLLESECKKPKFFEH